MQLHHVYLGCLKKMTDPLLAVTHHVNLFVVHHDASAQEKGKHQFVFLKQAATYVTIEAEGEIFIDVPDSLLHCVCVKHVKKKGATITLFTSGSCDFVIFTHVVQCIILLTTCTSRVGNTRQKDSQEPLQRVLVHWVNIGQI